MNPSSLFDEGQRLQWQGHYSEAIDRYKAALKGDPNNGQLYYEMFLCYVHMSLYDEAKICRDKAAQLDPKIAEKIKQASTQNKTK